MANLRFIQTQSFALQSSGASIGDTSITVQSFKYSDGVTNIVTADLGDQCYATLEPNNGTQEEAIQFTGVTQNTNGTATLTGVSSVGFNYPYSVTSGLKMSHAGGVTLVLSNDAAMYGNIISYVGSVVASGAPTATDTTAGITKLTYNQGSNPRARGTLVSQNGTGALNLLINTFSYQNAGTTITFTGKMLAFINGSAGSTFTAPVSNPRYDLIVYRPSLTDCTSITGTEGASPSLPTPTTGDIILASILHKTGETKILDRNDTVNGYIFSWYEPTPYTTVTNLNNQQVTFGTDQSNTTEQSTYAVGESNVTTKHSIIAQSFVPTVTGIQGVKLWKIADTGSFTGTVKVSLQANSGSSPSGSDLASVTITNANWLEIPVASEFGVAFTTEYESMIVGSTYWIVVSPSTSDNSNHPNLGYDNTSAHSLVLKFNNSADGWVTTATACLYFKSLSGVISKIAETLPDGNLPASLRSYAFLSSDQTTANTTSTTETTLYKKYVDGGFWNINSGFKIRLYILIYASSSNSGLINLKYANQTIYIFSQGSNATQPYGGTWIVDIYVTNNGSMNSQNVAVTGFSALNVNSSSPAFPTAYFQDQTTTAIDTTLAGSIEITGQCNSGTGANEHYYHSIIERITSYKS